MKAPFEKKESIFQFLFTTAGALIDLFILVLNLLAFSLLALVLHHFTNRHHLQI